MAVDVVELKQVLARRVSGVAIVTARAGDAIHGMTVSAFAEVSLAPPLVLVCADKTSNTHPVIARGGVFALNVLARDQAALSEPLRVEARRRAALRGARLRDRRDRRAAAARARSRRSTAGCAPRTTRATT